MRNCDKYKTATQLYKAFSKYCRTHTCDNCKYDENRGREGCNLQFACDEAETLLDPCPFCGGEAAFRNDNNELPLQAICKKCGATSDYGTREFVMQAWNRRTEQ